MKKNILFGIISFILSALLFVGLFTFINSCGPKPDGSWMRCHHARNVVMYFSLALTALNLFYIVFSKNRVLKIVCSSLCIPLSVVAFLIPGVILPMCMSKSMRCFSVMQPGVRIFSVLILIFSVLSLIVAVRSKNSKSA